MSASEPQRANSAVVLSVLMIVAYWGVTVADKLWARAGVDAIPTLSQLAVHVAVRAAIVVPAVVLLLRAAGESPASVGLRGRVSVRELAAGLGYGLAVFIITTLLLMPAAQALVPRADATRSMRHLFADVRNLPAWIFITVVGGGVTEELRRLFILTRFERLGGRRALVGAVVVEAAVFGLGHLYQGVPAAIANVGVGLMFSLVYLRRRSASVVMLAHAVHDLTGVALAFALYHR